MNKQLANQGTSMNKNMTNVESLVLTAIVSTNASLTYLQSKNVSFSHCDSSYINAYGISSLELDIPRKKITEGSMYFDTTSHDLYIYDGHDWNYVTLNTV